MRISDWSSEVCSSDLYERAAKRSDVRFVTMDDYRIFREVGLRGLTPDGAERPGARDRNGLRNALFADLLVTTGLRLEEASGLLAHELAAIDHDHDQAQQLWLPRSEEHTSELQSLMRIPYAVFCLKKTNNALTTN